MSKIRAKRKGKNFFVTGSNVSGLVNSTTVSSSIFTKMSQSFAKGEHLIDDAQRENQGAILFMLQELQDDVDDIYTQVSASQYAPLDNSQLQATTGSFTTLTVESGNISCSGDYIGNIVQIYNANFQDDISTTTHYVPIGTNNFEQTTEDADEVGFVAPYDGELVKIIYRHNFDASSTTTRWTYVVFPDGTDLNATPTNRFRATVTGATTDDIKEITVSDADGASLDDMFFNKGETIVLSIRNSADVTDTSSEFHVTVVLKFKIPSGLI